jgi:Flp pilus assembly protein TadG
MRGRRGGGQSLVEFALLLPIFLLLLVVIADAGRLVAAQSAADNAARQAVRGLIVRDWPQACSGLLTSDLNGCATRLADETAFGMAPNPVATVTCHRRETDGTLSVITCGDRKIGHLLRVSVTTRVNIITPIVSTVIPSMDLFATSTQTVEGVP